MDVYWLEQSADDVPPENDWLSPAESLRLDSMRIPKRRMDWRLGRWTAKRAIARFLDLPGQRQALSTIEIRPATSGAPEAFLSGNPAPVTISISHRAGIAMCTVASCGSSLGCDVEVVEPRSFAFVADYFTVKEQTLLAGVPAAARDAAITLLWSAKESALKALREGLRLDTRSLEILAFNEPQFQPDRPPVPSLVPPSDWRQIQVRCSDGQFFDGWWQRAGSCIRTLVASPSPSRPMRLSLQSQN